MNALVNRALIKLNDMRLFISWLKDIFTFRVLLSGLTYFYLTLVFGQQNTFSLGLIGNLESRQNEFVEQGFFGFNHEFQNKLEYGVGIQIAYQLGDNLGLRSGALYAEKGYELVYAWSAPNGTNGSGDPTIPMRTQFKQRYIDVPLNAYYQLIRKDKFQLAPALGVVNSFKIASSEISKMGDGAQKETSFYSDESNDYLMALRLAVLLKFTLSERLFLVLEPHSSYNFHKLNDRDIENSDLSFGTCLSLNFILN